MSRRARSPRPAMPPGGLISALSARPANGSDLVGRTNAAAGTIMKRDLYSEVSARIIAELEAGAAPWIKPWSATPGANTP